MTLLVLVILAVMWVVVLVPPLLRSRQDSRPSDSVVSFRRQLSTLQRTGPQLRPIGRGAPARGPVRGAGAVMTRPASYQRAYAYGMHRPARSSYRVSRVTARRRRQNVLFVLAVAAAGTLLLALGSGSQYVWYAQAVTDVLLVGYVYLLVQLRKLEEQRQRTVRPAWSNVA